jgi:hypothetical protein
VKGWKAMGNRLCTKAIRGIRELEEGQKEEVEPSPKTTVSNNLKPGDTIELDL